MQTKVILTTTTKKLYYNHCFGEHELIEVKLENPHQLNRLAERIRKAFKTNVFYAHVNFLAEFNHIYGISDFRTCEIPINKGMLRNCPREPTIPQKKLVDFEKQKPKDCSGLLDMLLNVKDADSDLEDSDDDKPKNQERKTPKHIFEKMAFAAESVEDAYKLDQVETYLYDLDLQEQEISELEETVLSDFSENSESSSTNLNRTITKQIFEFLDKLPDSPIKATNSNVIEIDLDVKYLTKFPHVEEKEIDTIESRRKRGRNVFNQTLGPSQIDQADDDINPFQASFSDVKIYANIDKLIKGEPEECKRKPKSYRVKSNADKVVDHLKAHGFAAIEGELVLEIEDEELNLTVTDSGELIFSDDAKVFLDSIDVSQILEFEFENFKMDRLNLKKQPKIIQL